LCRVYGGGVEPIRTEGTCWECLHFREAKSPNPKQAFGFCEKRKKHRYGCAEVCPDMEVKEA
jgi:hypothetical protein